MKKVFSIALATIIALSAVVGASAFAGSPNGRNYIDANNDGVCDNAKKDCTRNFVDADNDGVCDNYADGQGREKRHGSISKRECGFRNGNGFRGGRAE